MNPDVDAASLSDFGTLLQSMCRFSRCIALLQSVRFIPDVGHFGSCCIYISLAMLQSQLVYQPSYATEPAMQHQVLSDGSAMLQTQLSRVLAENVHHHHHRHKRQPCYHRRPLRPPLHHHHHHHRRRLACFACIYCTIFSSPNITNCFVWGSRAGIIY